MTARAFWKGTIHLGSVQVPVKLFSAVSDRRVHFRLLHTPDREPVEQRMIHPKTEETVDRAATRHGYQVTAGSFVVLSDSELQALEPLESRALHVLRFVPAGSIGPEWYARPYALGPDGDVEAYAALVQALSAEDQVGIVRWVMRKHTYVGALRSEGGHLSLSTLHHSDEIIPARQIAPEHSREPDARERAMAEQLVGMFTGEFDPSAYRDEYRERVQAFAEAKAHGKRPKLHKVEPELAAEGNLASVLAASLERARDHKVA